MGSSSIDRPTILLVDDDPEDLGAMGALLVGAGYEAIAACNGREALHHLTSVNPHPAVIVTDLVLPDMSGVELIHIIHAYTSLSVIPVIVVSRLELRAQMAGHETIAEYFKKPIESDRFLESVRKFAMRPGQVCHPSMARVSVP